MIRLTAYKELNQPWEEITETLESIAASIGETHVWYEMEPNMQPEAYPYEEEIAHYLETTRDNGPAISINGIEFDVFTGDMIGKTEAPRNDGFISWPAVLPYYIRKYHLRLPKEAEDHILKKLRVK